jgi:DNA-binding NarL/FixJ family response regulator
VNRPGRAPVGEQIRVLLADDHPAVREGLRRLLEPEPDVVIAGEARDGAEVCELARQLHPDVVVLDLSMPVLGGLDAAQRILAELSTAKVIALTVHEDVGYVAHLQKLGVTGYVLKRSAGDNLVTAIREVAHGAVFVDPSLVEELSRRDISPEPPAVAVHATLDAHERRVLVHVARGYSNREIARELLISVGAVEGCRSRVGEKLGLRTRAAMMRHAAAQGWLADDEQAR